MGVTILLLAIATACAQIKRPRPLPELKPLPLPKILEPDDWSFRSYPLRLWSQLMPDEWDWLSDNNMEQYGDAYCVREVELRSQIYQSQYPRYGEIAHLPEMQTRFLHLGGRDRGGAR